jgi:adenosine deaminase
LQVRFNVENLMPATIDNFIHALPKAETHLHLEGAIPWVLARQYSNEALPEIPAWLSDDYRFPDFDDFRDAMRPGIVNVLTSVDNYVKVAAAHFEQLVAQNARYCEISVGVGIVLRRNLNLSEIVAAIQEAVPPSLTVRLIAGINRRIHQTLDTPEVRTALETPGISGIDLQSDERVNGPEPFVEVYAAARDKGYLLRAHAGELTGANTIRATIDKLGVSRIEHGATITEDETLIERLIDEHITLDMCPTSNVKLCVVENHPAHPIGDLLRRGVRVTCSTDDPHTFNVTLTEELQRLVTHQAFTPRELAQLQTNAFEVALLPDETRAALIGEVQAVLHSWQNDVR